jgi:flagellar export protein FliJ
VKAFSFPLDRVRQYRETQVRLEEAKLERLHAERRAYETRRERLNRQRAEGESALLGVKLVDAFQLAALDRFGRHVDAQNEIVAQELARCDEKIDAQKQRLTEARRGHRLLEKLREKRLAAWQADYGRELETQAAELYLAQWPAQNALVESK